MYLLQKEPSALNKRDEAGRTPMFYVRNPKSVLLLLDFDNNGLERDKEGKTVLQIFLKTNIENAKALLCSKIDTNGKDYNDNDLLITFDLDLFKYERKAKVV